MCGIFGIVDFSENAIDKKMVNEAISLLAHRGPDDRGIYCEKNIALGHTRLSIIDLSQAGHQPMHSPDGRYVMVYNGEVFNYMEIYYELRGKGHRFSGHSDSEIVLRAYLEWGYACFEKFNGMFAIAIYDKLDNKITIARDRFGIKPLYYLENANNFTFASEIKAILAMGVSSRKINFQALSEYNWYGNALGSNTMFSDIRKVEPGTFMEIQDGKVNKKKFYYFNRLNHNTDKEEYVVEKIRVLFEDSIKRHLVSDVPVGVFLSGGIDSSAITALASKHYNHKLQTFSVGFDYDNGVNELAKAVKVSQIFKTHHNELHISADSLVPIIEELVTCHDEPFADAANIPLFLLSREIKGSIKVILQGDGGDEIFGGYSRYRTLQDRSKWLILSRITKFIPKSRHPTVIRLNRFLDAISERDEAIRHALLLTIESRAFPPERIFSQAIKMKLKSQDPFLRYKEIYSYLNGMEYIDKIFNADTQIILPSTFLEKVDKSTMANSLEVRVPFLDTQLAEYAMSLSGSMKVKNGEKKYLLKKSLRGIVPDDILDAPKKGFGVPYSYWLKGKLKNYLRDRINNSDSYLFNIKCLNKMIDSHSKGKGYNGYILWKALQLAIWIDKYEISLND